MTSASVQGAKVDLPKVERHAEPGAAEDQGHQRVRRRTVFLDAIPVSLSEQDSKLRDAKAVTPDLPVIIKGDRATQYDKIMSVLDLCGRVCSICAAASASPRSAWPRSTSSAPEPGGTVQR